MKIRSRSRSIIAVLLALAAAPAPGAGADAPPPRPAGPPAIPIGPDAFLQWEKWPLLAPTDEMDVGDIEDEGRHRYASPDATAPERLASRYELGVDRVPLPGGVFREVLPETADDGRRTRTWSEFDLVLRPDNLGVLLRRRLDLACPDQRARVLVSPAGGEPAWEEAGTWYTAGGSTSVFADPLGLPKGEVKGNPEVAPPARIVWASSRRWREDEFLIPRRLTEGRDRIRVRVEFRPVGLPLFPGPPVAEEAWTEFRYRAYCFVIPGPAGTDGVKDL